MLRAVMRGEATFANIELKVGSVLVGTLWPVHRHKFETWVAGPPLLVVNIELTRYRSSDDDD